jgi:anti-sigma factor RsiW
MNRSAEEHRHFEEDLAGYLVGSLHEADRIALEAHLDQCGRCRSVLDRLRPTVGVLAGSVPQLDPPRGMRRRILAAARSEKRIEEPRRRAPAWMPRFVPAAAVLGAAAVIIAIAVSGLVDDNGPGSSTVAVQPAAARAANAGGTLVVRDGAATLEVDRMPRLPARQVYETWLQRGGAVKPSTTFIVDRSGKGATTIPDVDGADQVMVTREPRGGSDRPTTAPVLRASL